MDAPILDTRKRDLLTAIVEEYVKTAAPVGSVTLVDKYGFALSPATIRNEMAELEERGLIEQPYTSSGRVPTERGFRMYVSIVIADGRQPKAAPRLKPSVPDEDPETTVRSVAKDVAEHAHEAVIVAFTPRHVYYTGLSHLFSQPEFQEYGRVVRFSELIDRLDDIVGEVFPRIGDQASVWIGRENPFGAQCGTVIARCATGAATTGAVAILGPMRMDYERCFALVNRARSTLEEAFGKI